MTLGVSQSRLPREKRLLAPVSGKLSPSPPRDSDARLAGLEDDLTFMLVTTLDGFDVLIVEDDDDSRELYEAMLCEEGAKVRVASNGEEALLLLEERCPDVLIGGIAMPDEDGYAFIRHARAIHPKLAAIAVTGFTTGADARRALEAGYEHHLAKPISIHDLVAAVFRFSSRRDPEL